MSAKPIIDILISVTNIDRVDEFNPIMIKHGYTPKGEYGMDGRRYFYKGDTDEHTHHIHIFEEGHPDIVRHLNFRDYMIQNPDKAKAYCDLKTSLAQKYPNDIEQYCWGKNDFISQIDQELKKKS